jgi:ATP-dependent DNA helicase RecG
MDFLEFQELLGMLQNGDESERVEAKKSTDKVGDSALETISAFSNEPGLNGGYLVLGLKKNQLSTNPRYLVSGVSDPDKLQNELVNLCRQSFSIPIRPAIDVILHPEGPVLVAYIPEAEAYEKPVYIKSKGVEKGAFRRIGPTDQICTREDFDLIHRLRSQRKFDETTLQNASWKDFDSQAIAAYRRRRKEINPTAKELEWTDQNLMVALGAAVESKNELKPTVAGIILFGSEIALRRIFPIATRIDYLVVDGKEWVPNPEKRYLHSYEFREALILAIPRVISHIMRDIPSAFSMQPNSIFRKDIPLIPDVVIREAVCNAVMHRDYSAGQTVQIIRYANRIEFQNPGYSLKPENQLGLPGSISRNDKIGVVFHDLNIAETKGTGIRTMREGMKDSNLSLPLFESDRAGNKFVLTLLSHHFFNEKDLQWLKLFSEFNLSSEEARALLVVREMGAITNADYRNINCVDTLSASASLRRLRDFGLLELKGKGSQTYYTPGKVILLKESEAANTSPLSTELTPQVSGLPVELTPQVSELPVELTPLSMELLGIPPDLKKELENLNFREPEYKLNSLILKICAVKPFRLPEIAFLLKRNANYLRERYLMPLIQTGELTYVFPHQPNHPHQAYKTKQ